MAYGSEFKEYRPQPDGATRRLFGVTAELTAGVATAIGIMVKTASTDEDPQLFISTEGDTLRNQGKFGYDRFGLRATNPDNGHQTRFFPTAVDFPHLLEQEWMVTPERDSDQSEVRHVLLNLKTGEKRTIQDLLPKGASYHQLGTDENGQPLIIYDLNGDDFALDMKGEKWPLGSINQVAIRAGWRVDFPFIKPGKLDLQNVKDGRQLHIDFPPINYFEQILDKYFDLEISPELAVISLFNTDINAQELYYARLTDSQPSFIKVETPLPAILPNQPLMVKNDVVYYINFDWEDEPWRSAIKDVTLVTFNTSTQEVSTEIVSSELIPDIQIYTDLTNLHLSPDLDYLYTDSENMQTGEIELRFLNRETGEITHATVTENSSPRGWIETTEPDLANSYWIVVVALYAFGLILYRQGLKIKRAVSS